MPRHLTDDEIRFYRDNEVDDDETADIEAHVANCSECAELLPEALVLEDAEE